MVDCRELTEPPVGIAPDLGAGRLSAPSSAPAPQATCASNLVVDSDASPDRRARLRCRSRTGGDGPAATPTRISPESRIEHQLGSGPGIHPVLRAVFRVGP